MNPTSFSYEKRVKRRLKKVEDNIDDQEALNQELKGSRVNSREDEEEEEVGRKCTGVTHLLNL